MRLQKVMLHHSLPYTTVRLSPPFSLARYLSTNHGLTASPTPFAISQPNNFYKSRYLETTLWSIKDCTATGAHALSASWKGESSGAQEVLICANADSIAGVPADVG